MKAKHARAALEALYLSAPAASLSSNVKVVVLSDLHLGDGSSRDDFLPNAELLLHILKYYYLENGYALVLNGDIEELLKFPLKKIMERWKPLYDIFTMFFEGKGLFKIIGNHDFDLIFMSDEERNFPCTRALKLDYGGSSIFLFHGHQVSHFFDRYNVISSLFHRFIAYPLHIRNYSVAHDSSRKYKIEKRVYDFSSMKKIVSIIGHTHRPLFESPSKSDSYRYNIENLCRYHADASPFEKSKIETEILHYKRELDRLYARNGAKGSHGSLYNSRVLVPCLFNSGCAIGKRGITSVEIDRGEIRLVHLFDVKKSRKYISRHDYEPERVGDTDYYRMIIKKNSLDYVFTRIRLLA